MHISKSQSYNLSPDEYLQKIQKPHSIISLKGKQQKYEQQIQILQQILQRYNQNYQTHEIKQKAISQLNEIINKWMKNICEEQEMKNTSNQSKQETNPSKDINLQQEEACKNQYPIQEQQEKQKVPSNPNDNKNQPIQQKENQLSMKNIQRMGYGLKIFGSYSLKTNSFDGDIDMICVVPDFFSRQRHFYSILTQQLKKNPNIKQVFAIPDAIVPLIKMNIYDVQIDLLIARIHINFLRQNPYFFQGEISEPNIYINEKQLKSVNGYRTSLYLKKNIKNYKNYQVVLKAIKMWAKNKGIYSQIYGYLGGAALSIMLAKICQMYPKYSPFQLIDRFFFMYSNWVWTLPVILEDCDIDEKVDGGMLIFTPLQPHVNSAYYVSKITCHITRKYLRLASKLIQQINRKKSQWKDLFTPIDFFNTYLMFIQLSVMGQKQQQFIIWKGSIESKIRKFIRILQKQIQSIQLIQIHPFPQHFISKHISYKYCYKYYFGIKAQSNPNLNDYCHIDFTHSVRQFLQLMESCSGIEKIPKQINIGFAVVERKDLDKDIIEGEKTY